MKTGLLYFCLLSLATAVGCKDHTKAQRTVTLPDATQVPNFKYVLEVPEGWGAFDTVYQDLQARYILAPDSLDNDRPRGNSIVAFMDGRPLDAFMVANINYLKNNDQSVVLQDKGTMQINSQDAGWFTYTRNQGGIEREMINYIIPLRGFACMITCGTNKGTMNKYRNTFDGIAASFRE